MWKQKKDKNGQLITHPNKIAKLGNKDYAILIAENINQLLNSELFENFYFQKRKKLQTDSSKL